MSACLRLESCQGKDRKIVAPQCQDLGAAKLAMPADIPLGTTLMCKLYSKALGCDGVTYQMSDMAFANCVKQWP